LTAQAISKPSIINANAIVLNKKRYVGSTEIVIGPEKQNTSRIVPNPMQTTLEKKIAE